MNRAPVSAFVIPSSGEIVRVSVTANREYIAVHRRRGASRKKTSQSAKTGPAECGVEAPRPGTLRSTPNGQSDCQLSPV